MKRKLSQWQWKWKQKLKASSTAWYGGSWKWKVESALFCILPWQLMRESTCPLHKESTFNRLTSKLNAYWQFDILSSCYSLISWFFSFWGYFECFNKWNDADTAIVTYIIPIRAMIAMMVIIIVAIIIVLQHSLVFTKCCSPRTQVGWKTRALREYNNPRSHPLTIL